jgi:uracil-DNA glycosylase
VDAKATFARCDDCPLQQSPFVGGWGPRTTDRVIVGQAPGETEVAEAKPFVGRAGRRLNAALAATGVDRSAIYVTNTVLCQPPGNESPKTAGQTGFWGPSRSFREAPIQAFHA